MLYVCSFVLSVRLFRLIFLCIMGAFGQAEGGKVYGFSLFGFEDAEDVQ
jgi:hypothetical protein